MSNSSDPGAASARTPRCSVISGPARRGHAAVRHTVPPSHRAAYVAPLPIEQRSRRERLAPPQPPAEWHRQRPELREHARVPATDEASDAPQEAWFAECTGVGYFESLQIR